MTKAIALYDEEDSAFTANLEERRAALAKLKVHPRDQAENSAAMARAERCYENFLAEKRNYVGELILNFQAALDTQDPRTIETARTDLAQSSMNSKGTATFDSQAAWKALGIDPTSRQTRDQAGLCGQAQSH